MVADVLQLWEAMFNRISIVFVSIFQPKSRCVNTESQNFNHYQLHCLRNANPAYFVEPWDVIKTSSTSLKGLSKRVLFGYLDRPVLTFRMFVPTRDDWVSVTATEKAAANHPEWVILFRSMSMSFDNHVRI
jgi:hypothetical protein